MSDDDFMCDSDEDYDLEYRLQSLTHFQLLETTIHESLFIYHTLHELKIGT